MTSQPAERTSRKEESSSQPTAKPPVAQPKPPQTTPPSTSTADEPNPEQIMIEFLQKLGQGVKASEFFTRMSAVCKQEEAASTLTPLQIPPRSSTLQETPTSQTLTSLTENPQISQENPQIQTETLAPASGHTAATEISQEGKAEGIGVIEKRGSDERVVAEENSEKVVVRQEVMGAGDDVTEPREDEGGKEGQGDEKGEAESSAAGDKIPDVVVEGETPMEVSTAQGNVEAIGVGDLEGETPVFGENVEGETPKVFVEGETHVVEIEGETPTGNEEKGIEVEIVVIDDAPFDDEGTPMDERAIRRKSRWDKRMVDTPQESQPKESGVEGSEEIEKDVSQTKGTPR